MSCANWSYGKRTALNRISYSMKNILLIVISLISASCYYDSEEALFGKPAVQASTCNIDSTKFSVEIKSILQSNCLSCHSNTTAASSGAGIKLQDYADVKSNSARFLGSVQQASGYSPMPKGGLKLTDCSISMIQAWITKGAPNN